MKLSDYVIDYLSSRGVTHIFEVAGGSITHLLNSLYDRQDITSVSMHHEQSAAFAAEGYARASGKIGVAMATSGPGATNLITGIGSCYFDSVPTLFITGQVNTYEYKFSKNVRQIGFQETDIASIVEPIVKEAVLVTDEQSISETLERLVNLALGCRQGPVLIDLPMNIQRAEIPPPELKQATLMPPTINDEVIARVSELIRTSSRPVILAGGGVRSAGAVDVLVDFARRYNIPVVVSLMGIDTFPHDDELYAGMIGTYGNRFANLTVANADLLIALGTRLDTRQTGTNPGSFARYATIVHVDIDQAELGNKVVAELQVHGDVKECLQKLADRTKQAGNTGEWLDIVKEYKQKYPSYYQNSENYSINPNQLIHRLSELLPEKAIVCVDIGQHQMWSAQTICIREGQRFMTEGGMASMGSALPMAIGAAFARPDCPIVVITGDGSFQMNIQELETVRYHKLPIKIIMLNNECYGMVRQFQHQYMNDRFQSTVVGYSAPDFQKIITAYGIPSMNADSYENLTPGLSNLFAIEGPAFLEVSISSSCIVTPKLGVNKPIEEQEPLLPPDEMRVNMIAAPEKQKMRTLKK